MKKVTICFDIDGTLRANREERHHTEVEANPRIVEQLIGLAHSKNTELHLWSNRGADYCQEMREVMQLQKYVKADHCHLKEWRKMQEVEARSLSGGDTYMALRADCFRPDIAYDDQQNFDGADIVIVVREK